MPEHSPTTPADASSRSRAIVTICAGVLLLTISDALTKWLVVRYGPFQILLVRSWTALPFVVAMVVWAEGWPGLQSARPMVHLWRGLLALAAAGAFILSLRTLPLAEATALFAAAPLVIAALSAPLLGERVGRWRWMAISAGFVGVLVVTRPGAAAFQAASGLALAATGFYALVMISARWIDPRDSGRTVMLYLTLAAALLSSFAAFAPWPELRASDAAMFLAIALAGTLGLTLITQAFRMAPAAVVAPFDYTALLWAGVLGWLVWGDVPDAMTLTGAAIIVASGLWLVLDERRPGRIVQER